MPWRRREIKQALNKAMFGLKLAKELKGTKEDYARTRLFLENNFSVFENALYTVKEMNRELPKRLSDDELHGITLEIIRWGLMKKPNSKLKIAVIRGSPKKGPVYAIFHVERREGSEFRFSYELTSN